MKRRVENPAKAAAYSTLTFAHLLVKTSMLKQVDPVRKIEDRALIFFQRNILKEGKIFRVQMKLISDHDVKKMRWVH